MHLLEEVLIGVAIGTAVLIRAGVGGVELGCSRVVDDSLEILSGNLVEVLPVGTASEGSAVVLGSHGLEGQGVALTVGTWSEVTAADLIAGSLKGDTSDESLNIGAREIVLAGDARDGTHTVHQWGSSHQLVENDVVDGIAAAKTFSVGSLTAQVGHVAKVFQQFAIGCGFQGYGLTIELSHGALLARSNHIFEAVRLLCGSHDDIGLVDDRVERSVGIVLLLIAQQAVAVSIGSVLIEALGIVTTRLCGETFGMALDVGAGHVGGIEESVAEHLRVGSSSPVGIGSLESSAGCFTGGEDKGGVGLRRRVSLQKVATCAECQNACGT